MTEGPVGPNSPLRIRLLGALEFSAGEERLVPRTQKAAWLLALLALKGSAVSRDSLAETLWPDSSPEEALVSLRQRLVDLRKALGPWASGLLSPAARSLALDRRCIEVDVQTFTHALDQGGRPGLRRAVELYSGPLLPGCEEHWVYSYRAAFEQRYVTALERLAAYARFDGSPEDAEGCLRRVLAVSPCREPAARALMELLATGGNTGAAVQVYHALRRALREELGQRPGSSTEVLYEALRRDRPVTAQTNPRTEGIPPLPRGPIYGRSADLGAIAAGFSRGRLVTLTGTGGVGKTRLALEWCRERAPEYAHGVVFVDFAAAHDARAVGSALRRALGVPAAEGAGAAPWDALATAIGEKEQLLAADNCEHVLPATADAVSSLLARCPELRVLATSRQRLNLPGEQVIPLRPLDPTDAVALLNDLASAAGATGWDDTEQLSKICHRVEGLPLALELAAGWAIGMGAAELASGLGADHGGPLHHELLSSSEDAQLPARHRSLATCVRWSVNLLPERDRRILLRCSVFASGWDLEAARAVSSVAGGGEPQEDVLPALVRLISRSLVVAEPRPAATRYRLLEPLRAVLRELLSGPDERGALVSHSRYFATLTARTAPLLSGARQREGLDLLEQEHGNCLAALDYLAAQPDERSTWLKMLGGLGRFWQVRGHFAEGLARLAAGLAIPLDERRPDHELRGAAAAWASLFALYRGEYELAGRYCRQSVGHWRQVDNPAGLAGAIGCQALLAKDRGQPERAKERFEESLTLWRETADSAGIAATLGYLGILARDRGELAEARVLYAESLALRRAVGDVWGIGAVLNNLGFLALAEGGPTSGSAARSYFEEALRVREELGDLRAQAVTLNGLAEALARLGELRMQADCLQRSLTLAAAVGERRSIAYSLEAHARLAKGRGCHDEAARLAGAASALRSGIGSPSERYPAPDGEGALIPDDPPGAAAFLAGECLSLRAAIDLAKAVSHPGRYSQEPEPGSGKGG